MGEDYTEEDYAKEMDLEGQYYSSFALCSQCWNFDGDSSCSKYPGMSLDMFARQKKCKKFKDQSFCLKCKSELNYFLNKDGDWNYTCPTCNEKQMIEIEKLLCKMALELKKVKI